MVERRIDEAVLRKGAVAAYGLQGKRHGDNAVRNYSQAKQTLGAVQNAKGTEVKIDVLARALIELLDGLVSQRQQIGSVSAQITSSNILN
jgi:hypothetical protein